MTLYELRVNDIATVVSLNILDKKLNIRLQELGLYIGSKVKILKTSPLKQTLLIQIFNSAFALKSEVAKQIEVNV